MALCTLLVLEQVMVGDYYCYSLYQQKVNIFYLLLGEMPASPYLSFYRSPSGEDAIELGSTSSYCDCEF